MNDITRAVINDILAARARLLDLLTASHVATQRRAVRSATLSGLICR